MITRRHRRALEWALTFAGAAALASCGSPAPAPAAPKQETYDSARAAGAALFDAAQKNDEAGLLTVLGPDAGTLVSSGDATEDADSRTAFVTKYKQMHRIGLDAENRTALFVGAENWPFPIPLASKDAKWYFDTDAGKKEILYRRIGRNEEAAIRICQELAAAQKEYFARAHDGDATHQYAQHFVSASGKHDGLFWEAANGDTESPIGPLLAFASEEAAAKAEHAGPQPFHGYYFRLLKAQGKNAMGGEESYLVNGKMTRGFAFLAYPAEYRSSGVMVFLVGPDGTVRQKDLGADPSLAKAITAFDPDETWSGAD
jgi:hypothetical protein